MSGKGGAVNKIHGSVYISVGVMVFSSEQYIFGKAGAVNSAPISLERQIDSLIDG